MSFKKLNRILIKKNFLDISFLRLIREDENLLKEVEPLTYYIISILPDHISTQYDLNEYMKELKEKDYLKKQDYFEFKEGKFILS